MCHILQETECSRREALDRRHTYVDKPYVPDFDSEIGGPHRPTIVKLREFFCVNNCACHLLGGKYPE